VNSGGETEPAAEQRPGAPPQDFTNTDAATQQQNASPSTDDSKTPAVGVKPAAPASAQHAPKKTTAKKSKRHRQRSTR
jgi:hypothetical protein